MPESKRERLFTLTGLMVDSMALDGDRVRVVGPVTGRVAVMPMLRARFAPGAQSLSAPPRVSARPRAPGGDDGYSVPVPLPSRRLRMAGLH